MSCVLTSLPPEHVAAFLPKAKVAVLLYRRYSMQLLDRALREKIGWQDADLQDIFTLIYDKKILTRKELHSRVKRQDQLQETLYVSVPQANQRKPLLPADALVEDRDDIWLVATGKWHIYKRTLTQDVATLLE